MLSCFSRVWLFATLWTIACQALLSLRFSRQDYWSGLPCPPPKDLPDPGIEPASSKSPALVGSLPLVPPGKPKDIECTHSLKKRIQDWETESSASLREHSHRLAGSYTHRVMGTSTPQLCARCKSILWQVKITPTGYSFMEGEFRYNCLIIRNSAWYFWTICKLSLYP